jgi:hypothetical protein
MLHAIHCNQEPVCTCRKGFAIPNLQYPL